ncbi:MAG: hypothetical protein sL5_10310 [Candidatus Mesenet longicola]|uniref:Uncharacterized protein n=1 Tax=Candidatus Mesenet longicola TaxID=1892558 RepID=A0A8J3HTL8_9RICK|nr:MAG: hypothetical protein sGL2_09340 [Candidatus Mesenet longicola]GHM60038.1 MAG: hypothetical protein sL5_10310 [Candidatus Mesenet longicola]
MLEAHQEKLGISFDSASAQSAAAKKNVNRSAEKCNFLLPW